MVRFQPVLPILKTNLTRRRGRTWQILGLVVLLFLGLTFIAVRYLPSVSIDPVSVLKSRDFQEIFVAPLRPPPVDGLGHDHLEHLNAERNRLHNKIYENQKHFINIDENAKDPIEKIAPTKNVSSTAKVYSIENLRKTFSEMSIDELAKIQSVDMRREKVREMVLHAYEGYSKYAWGANEHRPISKTGHSANVFGSHTLGITIIDSLDTIYLADLKDSYQKSREWIETQFNPNVPSEISAFEINIRLVGGFLSVHDFVRCIKVLVEPVQC